MIISYWLRFDPVLSWDGLLTFLGGLLAFFAILIQVRHADSGLRTQLKEEKIARTKELERQNRAIATAILFEVDDFYRSYVRDVLSFLEQRTAKDWLPTVQTPGQSPFPVYEGNCLHLGALKAQLVEAVVHFYGMARAYISDMTEYSEIYNAARSAARPYGWGVPQSETARHEWEAAESLLPRLRRHCEALVPIAFITCAFLCEFTGVEFEAPRVAVAVDKHVSDETHEAVRTGLTELRASTTA